MPLWLVVQSTSLSKWKWTRIWSKISVLFNQTLQGSFLVLMRAPVKERSERVHLQRHLFGLYHPQTQTRYSCHVWGVFYTQCHCHCYGKCWMSELQFRSTSAPLYWDSRVCSILEKNKDIKNNQDRYWSPIHTPLHWLTASSNQKGKVTLRVYKCWQRQKHRGGMETLITACQTRLVWSLGESHMQKGLHNTTRLIGDWKHIYDT